MSLKATVPSERVEQAAERAFHRLVQKVSIPGFRPGKAPRALYERTYGATHIYEEAARDLVDEIYRKVVSDEKLVPLDSPDVSITEIGPGQQLAFEATVPVRPTVALGEYRAHGQSVAAAPVTEDEVEKIVAGMREHHAELRPVQRPAQNGDVLTVDVDVAIEGRDLPPMGRGAHLELGRDEPIPGLAAGLLGAGEGDERKLELDFPGDHIDPDLRGKRGLFTVKVHQVAEKVLPALDDEFAKTVGASDLSALKQTVRSELAHKAFHEARDAAAEKAVKHAVDTATVDVPAILIEQELDHMMGDLRGRLEAQGMALEQFLLRAKKTEEQLRAEWREAATRRAASLLVLDEIARVEAVEISDRELAQELALMPVAKEDLDSLRSPRVLAAVARSLRNRKVIDRLLGIESPDVERELLERAGAVASETPSAASGLIVAKR